jgi:tetratricopeptide (TPR) repeat protein
MNQKDQLKNIELLLKNEQAIQAKEAFLMLDPENSSEYFLIRGKIEQKFQNWGEAINAFNKVLEIDPQNSEAQNNLHLIRNILNFWNPDMFNP